MPSTVLTGIKPSFSGGELAPSLYSRVDLAKYATGARKLRNLIVHPQGGISNRPGLEYIATEKTASKKIRLIPFEFSTTQTYVLEFGEYYCRFFKDGDPITLLASDTYAKLLLHCDGTDGSTTFTDETGKTVTAVGTAQIDTAQKKFGTASGLFDGDSDYLSLADSDDWNFGTGDFTIDFWVRFAGLTTYHSLYTQYKDSSNYIDLIQYVSSQKLQLRVIESGTSTLTLNAAWNPSINTWYHVALVRSENTWYIFIDGVSKSLNLESGSYSLTMPDIVGSLYIGTFDTTQYFLNGWLDEFRVSKGIARWTADFFVPTSAYDLGGDADAWVTATAYVVGDYVENSETIYTCLIAHTSGTFATDLANGKWETESIYKVVTPYPEADLFELNYTQSADVLFITHNDYAPRQLERNSDVDWDLNLYDYQGGPFQLANSDDTDTLAISAVTGTGKTLTAVGFTFDAGHVASLWELTHYIEGQAVSAALASVTTTSSIKCGGTWRLITHGTWTGTIRIEKSTDSGSTWTMLREFSSANDFNANTYGTEDMSDNAEPFLVRMNMTVYTSGTCNVNLTSDPFYQDGIVKITAVTAGGATATADVKRTCGATTATADWAEGSWSPYRGWPAVVEFHPEDRLVFSNTYQEPSTYWMTQTGDYYDFARSSPLVDSDGISSPLPSREVNGINGLVALTEMIALTLSNEVSIRSSSGPLTPTTVFNRVHGWEGSYGRRPVVIGNRVIYVQSTGSIIRDLGYDLYSDSFVGSDLTVFSNHLFKDYTIVEMAYQQNPDRLVWVVRSDGKLLSMTYLREQEMIAWAWHDTNGGTDLFESVCSIRGDGYDELWG